MVADNFSFTEGSGKTGAADDIGGVLHPRVKVGWGTDGTFNDVDTASGKALPVQIRDVSGNAIASLSEGDFDTKVGSVTETAPATDTASSGLNGRLQRIAQRITSLVALLPTALTGSGNFKVSLQESNASQAVTEADGSNVTIGAKADAKNTATDTTAISAMSVWKQISASVQAIATSVAGTLTVATHAVTQAGTWTVQPGNTANTTAWKVDGSAVTQPVSLSSLPASTNTLEVVGDVAQDAAAAGNPVLIGGRASTATPSAMSADGDSVYQWLDRSGAAVVTGYAAQDAAVAGSPMLNGGRASTATPSAMSADGDSVFAWMTRNGAQVIAGEIVDDAAFTPGTSRVVPIGLQADETSTDSVDEGDAGTPRMTLDRKIIVTEQPHTAGGLTMSKTVSAASTNATSVKGSAGKIYAIQASNVNTAARYLKLYNKATAPTVGTDTPVKTLIIPGNSAGAGTNIVFPTGIEFATGIAFALTTEATDAGTTAVAANEIVVNIDYK